MLHLFVLFLFCQAAPTTEELARQAVGQLLKRDYAALTARFTPEMKEKLPESALRSSLQPMLEKLGEARQIHPVKTQDFGKLTVTMTPVDFAETAVEILVTFNQERQIAGLFLRPRQQAAQPWQRPAYARVETFRERIVSIGAKEWELPGTLLTPVGGGPFPGLVLVHGSGPNDRDETIGPNKPFRDLAEGLATRGIAVLRYDKRTRVHGARVAALPSFTLNEETVDDAVAAAAFLRTAEAIDPKRVFVLGHSQGGYAAPRIGRRDPALAGLILLAASARPLETSAREQIAYLASLNPPARLDVEAEVARLRKMAPASFWKDLEDYRPVEEARALKTPLLVLQGERDYQVTMTDFELWRRGLAGRSGAAFRSYPPLNHLFMEGQGKGTPAEYQAAGHVAEALVRDLSAWIRTGTLPAR